MKYLDLIQVIAYTFIFAFIQGLVFGFGICKLLTLLFP